MIEKLTELGRVVWIWILTISGLIFLVVAAGLPIIVDKYLDVGYWDGVWVGGIWTVLWIIIAAIIWGV